MSTASPRYHIRTMTRPELDFAVDLAAKEGWNPGVHDADCFYVVDPQGYLIGLLDDEPISCISVVKYPGNYSFLGFYIVKDGFRGQGYGYQIWQRGMAYLEGYNIGLDGVLEQVPKYQSSGFKLAHLNARYQGTVSHRSQADPQPIFELTPDKLDALNAYDQSVFGMSRRQFLALWINRPRTIALGIHNDGGQFAGYIVARECREGYKIGPLFADSESLARHLFAAINRRLPTGTPIYLDIPPETHNAGATALIQDHRMTKVFETARMYRPKDSNTVIDFPLHQWFGITTFELG